MAKVEEGTKAVTVSMAFAKETTGTWQFAEVEEAGRPIQIGTLYVKNAGLDTIGRPKEIEVTVVAK